MKKIGIFFLVWLVFPLSLPGHDAESRRLQAALDLINEKDGAVLLHFLSSDLLAGRETSTPGYLTASEYAASLFALWGLEPGNRAALSENAPPGAHPYEEFFQPFELREIISAKSRISFEKRSGSTLERVELQAGIDYSLQSDLSFSLEAPLVFAGYGITESKLPYDDYKGLDPQGKILLILEGTPGGNNPDSPFADAEMKNKYARRQQRGHGGRSFSPLNLAREKGALAVIIISEPDQQGRDFRRRQIDRTLVDDCEAVIPGRSRRFRLLETAAGPFRESLPTIHIAMERAREIFALAGKSLDKHRESIDTRFKPASLELPGIRFKVENQVESELARCRNVIARLPGSEPSLADEYVIVGAHLDHLGQRGEYIFNGADDNASGSVAVLQVARALANMDPRPRRSIFFALWTGEEKGLLGSRHFVANSPVPIKRIKSYLNLDMIGTSWTMERLKRMAGLWNMELPRELQEEGASAADFIALSHSRHDFLDRTLRRANERVGMKMILRPSERAGGGSDHASFGLAGVPWVFFMAGMGEHYHRPGDHPDRVDSALMTRLARLAFLSTFYLAEE